MPRSINPATGETLQEYALHSPNQVNQKLDRAVEAFGRWRKRPVRERADLMAQAARVLRARTGELAELMTREMGKLISASEGEVQKCALACDYYATNGPRLLSPREIESDAKKSYVRYDPLGPVLAIMPWNFSMWQVFRFAAPALVAGNVGLLKHASNVSGTALAIESVFREAGFPEGCFATLLIDSKGVSDLIADDRIRAVTLTGSENAGISVGSAAGKALKKSVLELGGSDPFIVLADADIDSVAQRAAEARCINAGQSCIAAKRFIVIRSVADQFERAFTRAMQSLRVGDPMDRQTQVGPLAREDLVSSLHDQVKRTVAMGAHLLCGGEPSPGRGYYYPPTVLADVTPGMPAFDEETFGPVAAIIRADSAGHAVSLANRSRYGLGASIWTGDLELAQSLAAEIEAGMVFINGIVKSDPRLPFGGVKRSGYGRELADVGIHEFVNIKTVWVGAAVADGRSTVE